MQYAHVRQRLFRLIRERRLGGVAKSCERKWRSKERQLSVTGHCGVRSPETKWFLSGAAAVSCGVNIFCIKGM